MTRRVWLALLLLLACGTASAEDPPTPDRRADEVLAATEAGRTGEVARLARLDVPDPWLVADRLLARGRPKEALAYARAAPRPEVATLPAYLEGAPAEEDLAADRAALAAADDALQGGRLEDALAAIAGAPRTSRSIPAARIHELRGRVQEQGAGYGEAAAAYLASADVAKEIGWGAQESLAIYQRGVAFWYVSDTEHQEEAFVRRLAVEEALGSAVGMGRAWFGLAGIHLDRGEFTQWKAALDKALELAEGGGDHEYVAKILSDRALAPELRRDAKACLALSRQCLDALAKADGKGLPARFQPVPRDVEGARARVHLNCATWSAQTGDIEGARQHGRAARKLAETAQDPHLADRVRATLYLVEGQGHAAEGEDFLAIEAFEKGLRIYDRAQAWAQAAATMLRMGAAHARLSDHAEALALLGRAGEIFTRMGARPELGDVDLELGAIALAMGRTQESEIHFRAGLGLAQATRDRRQEADARAGLAQVAVARGDYGAAWEEIEAALAIQEGTGSPDGRGAYLLSLSLLQAHTGDAEAALRTLGEAETLLAAAGDLSGMTAARKRRAALLVEVGNPDGALEILERVLEEQRQQTNRGAVAETLSRIADVQFQAGRYADSMETRQQALGMYASLRQRPALVLGRMSQARALFFRGDRERALDDLLEVRDEAREDGSAMLQAFCAGALAEAWQALGKDREAMQSAQEALDLTRTMGLDLTEEEGAGLREAFASWHQIGALSAARTGDVAAFHEFLERGRATTLLASLGGRDAIREVTVREPLRRAEDEARSALAMAEARYAEARAGHERARAAGDEDGTREAWEKLGASRAALTRAQGALTEAVDAIERDARQQADLDYLEVEPLRKLAGLLAADEALVVYARLLDRAAALVVTTKGARIADLGAAKSIVEAVGRMLTGDDAVVDETAVGRVASLLVEPLKLPADVRRLLVSPDGGLAYVPFSLLDGTRDIALVPSATGYGLLREMPPVAGEKVLAMGDPLYEAGPGGGGPRGGRRPLARLEASGKEAARVGDEGEVYLRARASETQFRRLMETPEKRWRAVHLACHGHVDADRATLSHLALAADETNDGFLTAMDVFRLHVPADLVVLSGCETGLGRYREGEGILGLARAFMFAGSPRVLVSLWEVEDNATYELMSAFYDRWNPKDGSEGVSAARALRLAQEHVRTWKDAEGRTPWAHPRYWAAWVLWGLP